MKRPFLSSEQGDPKPAELCVASAGLTASSHELPNTLPYKACLANETLKGKISGDMFREQLSLQIS